MLNRRGVKAPGEPSKREGTADERRL